MNNVTLYHAPPSPAPRRPDSGFAVASMVLGILSVVFCWWGLITLTMIVLAITFAATAFKRAQTFLLPRNGMATAGLVLGIIGAVLYAIAGVLSFGLLFIV